MKTTAIVAGGIAALATARALRGRGWLRDKVVIVTGGARGLGLAIAREAAARGAGVAICSRSADELESAREDLEARGARVFAGVCDVREPLAVEGFVRDVERALGPADLVVNDAGILQVGPASSMGLVEYRDAMSANFFGIVNVCLAVLPGMRRRRRGRIVNVASIGGAIAVPHLLPYTASKFAAVGFSTGLRAEEARHGVGVITVLPGLIRTGSYLRVGLKGQREREGDAFAIAASLPGATLSVERAARKILRAAEQNRPFVTLGAQWKLARLIAVNAPATTIRINSLIARLLPRTRGGAGLAESAEPLFLHRGALAGSPLTALGRRAAERMNELPST